MTRLQQEYVHRVEGKIGALEIVDGKAVRVLGGGSDAPAVVPTTEELAAYVHEQETYDQIEAVQQDVVQRAEEKVAISQQTYSLVEDICKKLDSDLTDLEKVLNVRHEQFVGVGRCAKSLKTANLSVSFFLVNVASRRVPSTRNGQAQ
jgi:hypothetical protein